MGTGTEIKLDAEVMSMVIGKSILDQMTVEAKEQILQQSVQWLLSPGTVGDGYSKKTTPSPLEEAYRFGLRQLAESECRKLMETDLDMQKKVADVVRNGVNKAFEGKGRQKLVDKIADIVGTHFLERGRGY